MKLKRMNEMYYEDSQWSKDWRKWWHESCDKLGISYDTSFKDFKIFNINKTQL